jgi:hypothetical protein
VATIQQRAPVGDTRRQYGAIGDRADKDRHRTHSALPQPRPYTYLPPEAQPTEEEKQEAWRSVQGELPWAKPLPHLPAATPATQASEKWERDFRQCHIRKWFSVDELAEMAWQRDTGWTIIIEEDQIGDLEKAMRVIKKCKAFQKCLGDRHAGKVKRCYYNDKRWQLDEK